MADVGRLERARRLLPALSPDVLVLNEALWCRPHGGHFADYAALLGYHHATCALYDAHWGNAVLSRSAPVRVRRFSIYNRGGLAVTLPNGLTVATYHPHPGRFPRNKASD